jgi:hypothetical protein
VLFKTVVFAHDSQQNPEPRLGDVKHYADECSGRLRIGFTGNFSLGNQPIVKVVTVLATTLLIY